MSPKSGGKTSSQKFNYRKDMESLSPKVPTQRKVLSRQFIQPSSIYTNVAMQMVPPSGATNTASGTKA